MSLCPVCGGMACDHTLAQRGQTFEEMSRLLSWEEKDAWFHEPEGSPRRIEVAKKHAHDPVDNGSC